MKYFNKILVIVFQCSLLFLNSKTQCMLRFLQETVEAPYMPLAPGYHRTVFVTPSGNTYGMYGGDYGALYAVDGRFLPCPSYIAHDGCRVQCNSESLVVTVPVSGGVHNFIMKDADRPRLKEHAKYVINESGSQSTTDVQLLKVARNSCLKKTCLNAVVCGAGFVATIAAVEKQEKIASIVGVVVSSYNGAGAIFNLCQAYRINRYYQALN